MAHIVFIKPIRGDNGYKFGNCFVFKTKREAINYIESTLTTNLCLTWREIVLIEGTYLDVTEQFGCYNGLPGDPRPIRFKP